MQGGAPRWVIGAGAGLMALCLLGAPPTRALDPCPARGESLEKRKEPSACPAPGDLPTPEGFMNFTEDNGEWPRFFSRKHAFDARFPFSPRLGRTGWPQKGARFGVYQTHEVEEDKAQGVGYLVAVAPLPGLAASQQKKVVEESLAAMLGHLPGKPVVKFHRRGRYRGMTAMEYKVMTRQDGLDWAVEGLAFWAAEHSRLFHLQCHYAPPKDPLVADCDYFFQSFQLRRKIGGG